MLHIHSYTAIIVHLIHSTYSAATPTPTTPNTCATPTATSVGAAKPPDVTLATVADVPEAEPEALVPEAEVVPEAPEVELSDVPGRGVGVSVEVGLPLVVDGLTVEEVSVPLVVPFTAGMPPQKASAKARVAGEGGMSVGGALFGGRHARGVWVGGVPLMSASLQAPGALMQDDTSARKLCLLQMHCTGFWSDLWSRLVILRWTYR